MGGHARSPGKTIGMLWFILALVAALPLFWSGLRLARARPGSRPEYSHGPIIPILSGYLFLRDMRRKCRPRPGP